MDGATTVGTGGMRPDRTRVTASVRRLGDLNWSFPDQFSDSPFSDLHWHPSRFPSQIPGILIGRLSGETGRVLDPFMGSGTSMTEAQRLGRCSVGFDINPVACLMAKAKTLPWSARDTKITVDSLRAEVLTRWNEIEPQQCPASVQREKWYTRATLQNLERLWGLVSRKSGNVRILCEAAFSSLLLPACRETRHWGYVCDNTQPKDNRERDVVELFTVTLGRFLKAYQWRDQTNVGPLATCEIHQGSALSLLPTLASNDFECFITSPPYFGVADYVKSQRLSMEWFGWDIEPNRIAEIGARSKRHRKSAYEDYLAELDCTFRELYRVHQRGGWGAVVFGESPSRQSAAADFKERLAHIGFVIEFQSTREITEQRRQFPSIRREQLIVIRKPL